jgi:hypothetical protein
MSYLNLRDDDTITIHGLAGLGRRLAADVRRILVWEGIPIDHRTDTVEVGDLRDAGLVPSRASTTEDTK